MKTPKFAGAAGTLLIAITVWSAGTSSNPAAGLNTLPEYRVVHGWPVLPEGEVLGSVAGVGVDSHGNVFVFHRAGRTWPESDVLDVTPIARPTIDVFDGHGGALLRRWGANLFAMPHGLTIDAHDNVWLTDVALQQVYKFSPEGELLLTLGERGEVGNDERHFDRPTAVAVAGDGSFYVSDGYKNSRVIKFSADGKFLFQWGTKGTGPGQFDLPHWVALDSAGRVYVADRENQRIQVFDSTGHYLAQWAGKQFGRPYSIAVDRSGMAYVADGGRPAGWPTGSLRLGPGWLRWHTSRPRREIRKLRRAVRNGSFDSG